jgi:dTDP-4-amino-4,6-dideoxygalactose transaminase
MSELTIGNPNYAEASSVRKSETPLLRVPMNDFKIQWAQMSTAALAAVDRVGKSGWWILGEEVKTFESKLAEFWQMPFAVGCANGLDAIEIGLRALGLKPNDKVITTPLSAFATTLGILRAGGIPVFVDVDASGLIDLDQVERVLERDPSIRFAVPVHLFGYAVSLPRLIALRKKFGVNILEDCAQAIGAKFEGAPVGTAGGIAAVSFYPTKNLGAMGDGGALLTDSKAWFEKALCLRDYGQSSKYLHSEVGLNSRLDELQAAVLNDTLLNQLGSLTDRRRAIAQKYRAGISNPELTLVPEPLGSYSVCHLFPILVSQGRTEFQAFLKSHGVESAIHYPRLISDQGALKNVNFEILGALPRALTFVNSEVSLPMNPYLTEAQITHVIQTCNRWQAEPVPARGSWS